MRRSRSPRTTGISKSTAGLFGKLPGRVGYTAIVGAGTWADARCAVSCTGLGEYFIRVAAGAQLAYQLRFANQTLAESAAAVIQEVQTAGGEGGLIAVDHEGNIVMSFASPGMKRAALRADGSIAVDVF